MLNRLETESPGTKQRFCWGFGQTNQTQPHDRIHGREGSTHAHPAAILRRFTTGRHLFLLHDAHHRRHLYLPPYVQDDITIGEGHSLISP